MYKHKPPNFNLKIGHFLTKMKQDIPKPTYCCGDRLKPCKCGADYWKSLGDYDCGDWEEEQFQCQQCNTIIYIELPD